jgi:hypothetical protein
MNSRPFDESQRERRPSGFFAFMREEIVQKTEFVAMRCEPHIRQALEAVARQELVRPSEALRLAVTEAAERRGLLDDTYYEEDIQDER